MPRSGIRALALTGPAKVAPSLAAVNTDQRGHGLGVSLEVYTSGRSAPHPTL